MKRMISQALITWVKSLFTRIAPGEGDGDIEVGGNLEVDGNINVGGKSLYVSKIANNNTSKMSFDIDDEHISIKNNSTSSAVLANFTSDLVKVYGRTYVYDNLFITSGKTLTIGATSLSEAQLQKLIALIPE